MKDNIIKFRDQGEGEIISRIRESFNLPNDSVAIRMLIRQGEKGLNDFLNELKFVTRPLKYSEIDYFTSSLNIILQNTKRANRYENWEK
jgi:hypothetical protein